eukprot:58912_1
MGCLISLLFGQVEISPPATQATCDEGIDGAVWYDRHYELNPTMLKRFDAAKHKADLLDGDKQWAQFLVASTLSPRAGPHRNSWVDEHFFTAAEKANMTRVQATNLLFKVKDM